MQPQDIISAWNDQSRQTAEYTEKFYASAIVLYSDTRYAYVGVLMPLFMIDWCVLLKSTGQYSFSWALREVFAGDDQKSADPGKDADPLTEARDMVFAHGHDGIAKYCPSGDKATKTTCGHYQFLVKNLLASDDYKALFTHVMGTGGLPWAGYAVTLRNMGAVLAYCNRTAPKRADEWLTPLHRRLGLTLSREATAGQAIIKNILLGGMAHLIDDATFTATFTWTGDMASPGADTAQFFDIFANQYLVRFDPESQELARRIQANLDELRAVAGKKPKETMVNAAGEEVKVKTARKNLDVDISRLQKKLQDHQLKLLEPKTINDGKGGAWNKPIPEKRASGLSGRGVERADPALEAAFQSGTAQRLSLLTGHLISLLALCNTALFMEEIVTKAIQGKGQETGRLVIKGLPHALLSAEAIFGAFSKKAAKRILPWAAVAAVAEDTVCTVELVLHRDYDAAVGAGMMLVSGGMLAGVFLHGGAAALAAMSTPVTAALFLMLVVGFAIYMLCKDSDLEEFLKNGIWSEKGRADRKIIPGARLSCLNSDKGAPWRVKTQDEVVDTWNDQSSEVAEYTEKFYASAIVLYSDAKDVYVGVLLPLFMIDNKKKTLKLEFSGMGRLKTLTPEDAVAGSISEDVADGMYRFEACFDVPWLKEKIISEQLSTIGCHPGPADSVRATLTLEDSDDAQKSNPGNAAGKRITMEASINADKITAAAPEHEKMAREKLAALSPQEDRS